MRQGYILLSTAATSLGIGCSLLIAMLIIEYTLVENFENILAYCLISALMAAIYFIFILVSQLRYKQKKQRRLNKNKPCQ